MYSISLNFEMLKLLLAAVLCLGARAYDWDEVTALDEYVHRDDGVFSWNVLTSYRFDNDSCTVYVLNMTSHRWMDESFSSRPIWTHYVGVAIPDNPRRALSYMYIEGGGITSPPPAEDDSMINLAREVAGNTGYFGAFVRQVPNQGIIFANDPDQVSRTEDRFIAWTWKTYVESGVGANPEMIARMPMTKAGVNAMTCITQFVQSMLPEYDIQDFVVGGGSKRGWTAWSVAATDRRVKAVTPYVMSLMNFNDTLQAHYRNLGGWSFAFKDYWDQNLTARIHEDIVTNWEYGLWTYEDMYRYKERLELIPKLVVNGAGDEFFICTDTHTWWDGMGGPKWFMMNQNAEHSLVPWYDKIGQSVLAWVLMLFEPDFPEVPQMSWLRGPTANGGRILLSVDQEPDDIYAWNAHTWRNETDKDFRLVIGTPPFIHPVIWHKINVTRVGPGTYDVEVPNDPPGFNGVFIDAVWTRLAPGLTMHLTTEVEVTPDIYPHPSCYGEECRGTLV